MASDLGRIRQSISCDACRIRKCRCVRLRNGSCQRCKALGRDCTTSDTKISRPYYQTSKEQYALLETIVHHFLPGTTMEADSLRLAASALPAASITPVSESSSCQMHTPPSRSDCINLAARSDLSGPAAMTTAPTTATWNKTYRDAQQRIDIGTGWTSFLKKFFELNIGPARLRTLQDSAEHFTDGRPINVVLPAVLPSRETVSFAAKKVFKDVNSIIYILQPERFEEHVTALYDRRIVSSNAAVAIMLAVVALGCGDHNCFTAAGRYIDPLITEASFESIQALILLSLYRLNWDDRNAAWVLLGSAVRIGYTLGLHQHPSTWVDCSSQEQVVRSRVAWTLYTLDVDLTCSLGRPQRPKFMDEEATAAHLVLLEQMIDSDTVPGWHAASAGLSLVTHKILHERCAKIVAAGNKSSIDPRQVLADLSAWWQRLPTHLQDTTKYSDSHLRAVSFLSRRYHFSIIETTRSFLLESDDVNNCCYAQQCIEANKSLISTLLELFHRGVLSQISYFDIWHCAGAGMILHLRALRSPTAELLEELERFEPVLASMQHTRFGRTSLGAMRSFIQVLREFVASQSSMDQSVRTSILPVGDIEAIFEQFCQSLVAKDLNWGA